MAVRMKIVLDTRREKNLGLFPVKLRVTYNRKPEHYTTIYDLSVSDFKKLSAPRISETLNELRNSLNTIENDAVKEAKQINPFSFKDFQNEFITNNSLFYTKKY